MPMTCYYRVKVQMSLYPNTNNVLGIKENHDSDDACKHQMTTETLSNICDSVSQTLPSLDSDDSFIIS